jgi:hypothetical protein
MKATLRRIVLETARSCCAGLLQSRRTDTLDRRTRGRSDCCSQPKGVCALASDIAETEARRAACSVSVLHRR